jgi:hypothetical protein
MAACSDLKAVQTDLEVTETDPEAIKTLVILSAFFARRTYVISGQLLQVLRARNALRMTT